MTLGKGKNKNKYHHYESERPQNEYKDYDTTGPIEPTLSSNIHEENMNVD